MNYIIEYFNKIKAGKCIVSKRVYKQYEKLVNDINNPGKYIFDEDKAVRPINFIETFFTFITDIHSFLVFAIFT